MKQKKMPFAAKLMLILLFVAGVALNALIILDVGWAHRVLAAPDDHTGPAAPTDRLEPSSELDKLKTSILLVVVESCDGSGANSGTAFLVKPGYLATAAHVVGDHIACGSEVRLVDYSGVAHTAIVEAFSDTDDLALLSSTSVTQDALRLADSGLYEQITDMVPIVTIGYPLVGTVSEPDSASISSEGNIGRYDMDQDRFVTSGININPGNSGGPVFLREEWTVLGIASAKLDPSVGEGVGYVIPSNTLKRFFLEKTGQDL